MRILFSVIAVLLLTAAGPAKDWAALFEAGKEKAGLAAAQMAADKGDLKALNAVAWCYHLGRCDVAADPARAAALYRQSAEKGDRDAQWQYGVMLDTADGVPLDSVAAMGWFRKAAAQGSSNAYVSMGVMYSGGRGVTRDYAKALDNYRQAARRHNVHAFNEIGIVYFAGEGVPPDKIEGMAYFIVAASYGDAGAKERLQVLADELGEDGMRRAAVRANELVREFNLGGKPDDNGDLT
jgi:TPR repeat protein